MDLISFNDPWEAVQAADAARGPGSEPDHPGGPLYVPPPAASSFSGYTTDSEHVRPPPLHVQPPQQQWATPPQWFNQQQPWYPPPQQQLVVNVQLPPFWTDRPMAWFATVEARFRLNHVEGEQLKFDLLVNALPVDVVAAAIDIVERPPAEFPYTALKHRLLSANELTDYQKISRLLKMEPLGGRRPSELLTAMLDSCPRGQETNIFFTHLFLERLPAELRIMLGAAGTAATPANSPAELAQLQSGLCFFHWRFGDKAKNCKAPCNWGN